MASEKNNRNKELKALEKSHKEEVKKASEQYIELRERLPKVNIYNLKKSEKYPFWEQIPVKYIQYPDNETLASLTNQEVQPVRLGLYGGYQQYSLLAQFGNLPEFRCGYNKDDERLHIQTVID